jgi:glycosyltransferase involved in cell wall biosynthesis
MGERQPPRLRKWENHDCTRPTLLWSMFEAGRESDAMRVCFVGKYPPIQGGVSTSSYWMARALAARGHEIHIVTNAGEVEDAYRMTLAPGDVDDYEPRYPSAGGYVCVHETEPYHRQTMGHIPASNPFVTKLASLATEVVRHHDCDLVFAYYYEPYGIAGWLASRWTDRPLIVKHAGSDLDRLFRAPGLATAYREMLRSADGVVTRPDLMPRFVGMGVAAEQLLPDVPFIVPEEAFRPGKPAAPDNERPVIGVYGKIGQTKGTWDLVVTLGGLAEEGLDFELRAMIGHVQGERLRPALRDAGIVEQTRVLPLTPHWRVPDFIRGCTAVCFLERDFPVAIHGPVVPHEVLACGTCLVLSGEIAGKQRYRDRLVHGGNALIVEDPRDHEELAAALRIVLTDPDRAHAIGMRGHRELRHGEESFAAFGRGWEAVLQRYAAGVVSERSANPTVPTPLDLLAPSLVAAVREHLGTYLEDEALSVPGEREPHRVAIAFCEAAERRLAAADELDEYAPKLREALRYQRLRLLHGSGSSSPPDCLLSRDRLLGANVSAEAAGDLRPQIRPSVRVERFDYDISQLFFTADGGIALDMLPDGPLRMLFQRAPNLSPCELRINEATDQLIARCDGTASTNEIIEAMLQWSGAGASTRESVAHSIVVALEHLHRVGVVAFGGPA